jgi:DNA-binding transcriptional LysR family regulator
MNQEQLSAFEQVVFQGSFSAAARSLDLSQPTVTARIQTLEQELGGPLFVRGGKQLELTERGKNFLPYALRILQIMAEGLEANRQTESGQRGQLKIGVTESLTGGFLAASLARFYQDYSEVEYFIRTGHSRQVAEMLHDGLVRLGLLTWPHFDPGLLPLLIFQEPLVLVVPANHALTNQATITLKELKPFLKPFLLVRWNAAAMGMIGQFNLEPWELMEVPLETVRYMLRQGVGVSLLTRTLVAQELKNGSLVELKPLDLPLLYRESALVKLANGQELSQISARFIEFLEEEARSSGISVNRHAS